MVNEREWVQPDVSAIYLINGETVEAEVNGKGFDGLHGWVFADGRDIKVVLVDSKWWEDLEISETTTIKDLKRFMLIYASSDNSDVHWHMRGLLEKVGLGISTDAFGYVNVIVKS